MDKCDEHFKKYIECISSNDINKCEQLKNNLQIACDNINIQWFPK
jgi:hypothetical protein